MTNTEIVLILIMLSVYFFPAIVASARSHTNSLAISVLTLFTAWSALGWIIALVWACTNNTKARKE